MAPPQPYHTRSFARRVDRIHFMVNSEGRRSCLMRALMMRARDGNMPFSACLFMAIMQEYRLKFGQEQILMRDIDCIMNLMANGNQHVRNLLEDNADDLPGLLRGQANNRDDDENENDESDETDDGSENPGGAAPAA